MSFSCNWRARRCWHIPAFLGRWFTAGFFGIGGGFFIVLRLMLANSTPLQYALGSSLAAITALGLTTDGSNALSGFINWQITSLLVAGGILGTLSGIVIGKKLGAREALLERGFAALVIAIGAYIAIVAT
ncbi:TSUP family transporter [Qipengyuania sp. GH25]|uniref:Probable membrane transporter protein n=1 Tax=Qipengyuania pacifica TaxID=2860199 RepID=A0ABS7JKD9_9SPHN|nr:TSUP family transporter [Qipengyuania aerophila]